LNKILTPKKLGGFGIIVLSFLVCPVFQKNDFAERSFSTRRIRYICASCFASEGGHIYIRQGRGAISPYDCTDQHHDDSAKSLQFLARWINDISDSVERDIQHLLLYEIFKGIVTFFEKAKFIKNLKKKDISDEEHGDDKIRENQDKQEKIKL
ncbi:12880_t:CDS:1, partial [Racocetra persica]